MDDEFVFLITANDEIEAKIIESKLKYYDIPVLLKHQGAGEMLSLIAGFSKLPVDILIRVDDLNDARDIMDIQE